MIVMEIMEACHRVVALVLVFLFLVPVSVQARSNGQGAACNDATATLCNYECPESVKAWMVPWAKLKDNGRFGPCCPPGMDLVAPPTRNNAYRIHLQGVGGTTNRKPTLTFLRPSRFKVQTASGFGKRSGFHSIDTITQCGPSGGVMRSCFSDTIHNFSVDACGRTIRHLLSI